MRVNYGDFHCFLFMKKDFKRLLETKQRILCFSEMNSSWDWVNFP